MPGSAGTGRARAVRLEGALIAGRFRIKAVLGAGGMGSVYRVTDEPTGRELALKTFGGPAARAESDRHTLRFRREFHTMARLTHPNIVRVFEYGLDGDVPYYTMELLDGLDLGDLGTVDAQRACALLRDIAGALAFLHSRRLIHRDLAPRNVRCTALGRAKLIDFGVLATVGFTGDIAGTAPHISPENVRGLPLDHRADLYGLGALAYWLLSGRNAYPARTLEDLGELWHTRPLPPSTYAPGIPPALDDLVMSLLSLDPLSRPGSAAEVIDRLGAIGGLPPTPEVEVESGYLASASLVGRQREMEQLRRRLTRAKDGAGGAIVLEAPSGRGKSRLLRELGLEAQIAGATLITADSESADRGPYGLLRALARGLLAAAPAEALAAARPRAAVLARVIPEVIGPLGPVVLAHPAGGPEEQRMRAQAEVAGWFLDVAKSRALVVLVDDVQRSDEASAAVLAALAHAAPHRRLLLTVALRTDEPIRASGAVATLRELSHRVRLRTLDEKDVEDLMHGLFGDAPHLTRLATWMQKAGGGNPLHTIELARNLVDRGIIRYTGGIWSIPDDPHLEGMPQKLADAMEARIGSLSPPARALAEALSVHGGELPLPICVTLAEGVPEEAVFVALDELVEEEVLVGSKDAFRFRHDGLREALLRGLAPDRKAALHLRVGNALAGQSDVRAEREVEVGWHLLRGGDRQRGAALLALAGRRLYEAQSFSDAVAPLEAALEVGESAHMSPREALDLRHMLVMVGCFSQRTVALRYAEDTIRAFAHYSGMEVAERLARIMPRVLALAFGVALAAVRWVLTPRRRRGPGPVLAMQTFYVEVVYMAVVRSMSLHVDEVRALMRKLEILTLFKRRIPAGTYLFTAALLAMPLGQFTKVERLANAILDILTVDHISPISDIDRKGATGGAYYMLAMVYVMNQMPRCMDEIAHLDGLDLRYFEVSANVARIAYRRLRGEEAVASELEARTDVLLVQAGSMWAPEASIVWLSSIAYGLTRDVLGLRRAIDEVGRLVEQGFHLSPYLDLARGEYARERGELDASLASLARAEAALDPDEAFVRPIILGALAETHLAREEIDLAIVAAEKAIGVAAAPEANSVTWRLRGTRVLALAEAARGDVAQGVLRLDRAIDEATVLGSPSLCGGLHEARARLAFMQEDVASYALHRNATDSWFRATSNPALIARIERLPDPTEVAPRRPPDTAGASSDTAIAGHEPREPHEARERITIITEDAVTIATDRDAAQWVSAMLTGCRGAYERSGRALELLVEASGAIVGYLYLVRGGSLELMAPDYGEEPPDAMAAMLEVAIRDHRHQGPIADRFEPGWQPDAIRGEVHWYRALFTLPKGGVEVAVGAVALVGSESVVRRPSRLLVDQVAKELYEAGDVTLGTGSRSA